MHLTVVKPKIKRTVAPLICASWWRPTGPGDKRVMPTALRTVTGDSCLAWHDLMARGAGIYEVHLRVPAAHVASAKRSVRMLVKHPAIEVAPDATFGGPPTNMADPFQVNC